ncbi:MAG: flagellar basal body-associated protein FliL [Woeseiaceae bacterium]
MAEENEAVETETEETAPEQSGGKMKMLMFAGAGLTLLVIGIFAGPAVMNLISPPEEEAAPEESAEIAEVTDGPPIYQSLHPPLVVNFRDESGDAHFMQITMEVMAREQTVINTVRDNMAVIRNALILLYGGSVYEDIQAREGKEKMLADGLAEIRRVMKETTGESVDDVEALYFTALVIQ